MKQLKQQRYLGWNWNRENQMMDWNMKNQMMETQALEDPSNDETTEAAEIPGVELEQGEPDDGLIPYSLWFGG
ncbi:unnamed protein product [Ambrosiozyma monospora]|uniref:Unnamed protein product n=1 Tax=Ambrosiozyma monospora TaxID=43982 RepID=A0A9W6T8I3_AMBMO|nr:unnamed protein product [Ambrosiozyma monospora]